MPMFHRILRKLNHRFDPDQIGDFVRHADSFSTGQRLDASLILPENTQLRSFFQQFLDELPGGIYDTLRNTLYYALSATPPIPIEFVWRPGYDHELTLWHQPCGIFVEFRGPRPQEAQAS